MILVTIHLCGLSLIVSNCLSIPKFKTPLQSTYTAKMPSVAAQGRQSATGQPTANNS